MNRATRRTHKTIRIPEWQIKHVNLVEKGYTTLDLVHGHKAMPEQAAQDYVDAAQKAWVRLSTGAPETLVAQWQDWKFLGMICNITRQRATEIAEANPQDGDLIAMMVIPIDLAESALRTMQQRGLDGHNLTPCPLALCHVPELIDFYTQIVSQSTPIQMQRAIDALDKKIHILKRLSK